MSDSGIIVDGDSIMNWRDKVSQKYSKLPGIRELHDFLLVKNPTANNAMMLVREFCHGGAAKPTTLSLNSGVSPDFNCSPGPLTINSGRQEYCNIQNWPTYSKCAVVTLHLKDGLSF